MIRRTEENVSDAFFSRLAGTEKTVRNSAYASN